MVALTRKELGSKLIFFQLFYVMFYNLLCDYLGAPRSISFVIDAVNIVVFAWLLFYEKALTEIIRLRLQYVLFAALLLLAASWLTAILNAVPFLLVLWSTRNSMRFFPFFFSVIIFWNNKSAGFFSKTMFYLQIPNSLFSAFQFFVLNKRGDHLGGLFGTATGCNAYLYVFLLFVVTLVVQEYLHGKKSFLVMCATCFVSMIIAAMAELKVVFIVVPLVIIASFVLNKTTMRTFLLAVVISIALIVSVNLIIIFFPAWADSFSSIAALIDVGKDTGGGYDIPRLGAFSKLNELFFRNSIVRNIIGLGFGSCEYSSYDFLTTDFYLRYGILHYRWFTHMMTFLQTGYLGITCYALFILAAFSWITKMKKRYGDPNGIGSFGQITCGLVIINFAYNSSLTTESGYVLTAVLALPFVYYKGYIFAERRKQIKNVRTFPEELPEAVPEAVPEAIPEILPNTVEPEFFM